MPGEEFRVNTYEPGVQAISSLAADARGRFVAEWGSNNQDGDMQGVFARQFDRLGGARGPEIPVNLVTVDNQMSGVVGSDAEGNFVVVWERSEFSQGTGTHIVARRFDRAGSALGPEFLVSPGTSAMENSPAMAMQPDGRFVVMWYDGYPPWWALRGRAFDAGGNPAGSEFALSSATHIGGAIRISVAPSGGYLVTWGPLSAIYAHRIDAAGVPVGTEFQVNSGSNGYHGDADSSFNDSGGFVVTWHTILAGGGGMMAQRFSPAGTPLGPEIQVNDLPENGYCCTRVASDRDGGFIVLWTAWAGVFDLDVLARRFDASGNPLEPEFQVPFDNAYFQEVDAVVRAKGGHFVTTYTSDVADTDLYGVLGRLLGIVPMAMTVDASPMQSNGNGVLEAGETVTVAPSWANADRAPVALTATMSEFSGPGSAIYTLTDATAAYGTVALQATASCTTATDCYALSVSHPTSRPAMHWDAIVRERLTPRGDMDWSLHVGGGFADVPSSNPFYRFIETLLHRGVTSGCAPDGYCPSAAASREQMAAFVLAAQEGAGYQPRACQTPVFADVPASSPFCRFVEELVRRGVVSGCGGGNYCPGSPVTREEMAVFVLRTKDPAFTPPSCTVPMFADVPASSPFCRWIEELARRGVVTGCGNGNYCPTAPVTREQMGVFISVTFGLTLYGP